MEELIRERLQVVERFKERFNRQMKWPLKETYMRMHQRSRKQCVKLYNYKSNGRRTFLNTFTQSSGPSMIPMNSLVTIPMTSLRFDVKAEGKRVPLRVIATPCIVIGMKTIVQDPNGTVCELLVYNWPSDEAFPIGTVLYVKEPILRMSLDITFCIRVDCPTDLEVVIPGHCMHTSAGKLIWKYYSIAPKTSDLCSDVAMIKIGIDVKKDGSLVSATEIFKAAKEKSNDDKLKRTCLVNLLQIYWCLRRYEDVIATAKELEFYGGSKDWLLVACKAYYKLGIRTEALKYCQRFAELYSNVEPCGQLVLELNSDFHIHQEPLDVLSNMMEDIKYKYGKLKFENFIGDIVARDNALGEKVYQAAMPIRESDVLLASKAIVSNIIARRAAGIEYVNGIVLNTTRERQVVVALMARKLMKNPKKYFPLIHSLPVADHLKERCREIILHYDQDQPIVDIQLLNGIYQHNCYDLIVNYYNSDSLRKIGKGIFGMTPRLNHNDTNPNAEYMFFNDVIVVLANRPIAKGEEIVVAISPIRRIV
ncbi:hypothetical protein CHUAL_012426 [Chamberlinius hualienensis]